MLLWNYSPKISCSLFFFWSSPFLSPKIYFSSHIVSTSGCKEINVQQTCLFLQEHLTKFLSFISVTFPGTSGCKHKDQTRNLWCCTLEALLDAADCSNSIHGQPITAWTVSRTSGDLMPELFPGGKWRDFFFTALNVTAM